MPRTSRASQGGYVYHGLNRGNGRSDVFHKPDDFAAFVRLMREAHDRVPMRLTGYCLLKKKTGQVRLFWCCFCFARSTARSHGRFEAKFRCRFLNPLGITKGLPSVDASPDRIQFALGLRFVDQL